MVKSQKMSGRTLNIRITWKVMKNGLWSFWVLQLQIHLSGFWETILKIKVQGQGHLAMFPLQCIKMNQEELHDKLGNRQWIKEINLIIKSSMVSLKNWGFLSKACRNFTVEERQRALLAARLFKPSQAIIHSWLF